MDAKVRKYRSRHRKCKYCKYLKCKVVSYYGGNDHYYLCVAKNKIINDDFPDMTEAFRPFCSCYEVEDEEETDE